MKLNDIPEKWLRIAFITAIVLFLLGTLDPMEGSILIAVGSLMLAFTTYLFKDPQHPYFRAAAVLILFGVLSLWILSSMGGFGGDSDNPYWWGLFILPYPLGWILTLFLFLIRLFKGSWGGRSE
ncbi:hypothetical protein [Robiginitalea sp. IMCC43444]|uniref:hypothetical protein n=1 Tax=Robiginitalea sp. IMCC43444 TaxID=3459121 RepID=UPI004041C3E0